jgi:D-alanyl-D-alanine endopeptidase (penicillin-binding protein 7)
MFKTLTILLLSALFYSGPAAAGGNNKSVPITASSWLIADGDGKILNSENINEQRSIASITKLMTVMVVLDAKQDLDEFIKPYTRRELIQLSIVHSDNRATQMLCEHYPGGTIACVNAMNTKAHFMGLRSTRYVEPTGLSVFNVSTAQELVTMVRAAANYPEIVEASKTAEMRIRSKKSTLVYRNTNPIIGKKFDFIVSKTGWIRASGGCIVMMLDTSMGRRIVVLLNSKNTRTRIPEAELIALSA